MGLTLRGDCRKWAAIFLHLLDGASLKFTIKVASCPIRISGRGTNTATGTAKPPQPGTRTRNTKPSAKHSSLPVQLSPPGSPAKQRMSRCLIRGTFLSPLALRYLGQCGLPCACCIWGAVALNYFCKPMEVGIKRMSAWLECAEKSNRSMHVFVVGAFSRFVRLYQDGSNKSIHILVVADFARFVRWLCHGQGLQFGYQGH